MIKTVKIDIQNCANMKKIVNSRREKFVLLAMTMIQMMIGNKRRIPEQFDVFDKKLSEQIVINKNLNCLIKEMENEYKS